MAPTYITVTVVKDGKPYADAKVEVSGSSAHSKTDRSGKCMIESSSSSISIRVNGRTMKDSSTNSSMISTNRVTAFMVDYTSSKVFLQKK